MPLIYIATQLQSQSLSVNIVNEAHDKQHAQKHAWRALRRLICL